MFGLENSSFLINLAVSLLIALITLLYFRQQLATLDHKVDSMFSLMTSMTQELNNLSRLNLIQDGNNEETMINEYGEQQQQQQTGGYDQRISVSDSEEDNDSESSEEDDNSESSEEDDNSESSEEDESINDVIQLSSNDEIKTLNMGSELHTDNDDNDDNIKIIDMTNNEEDEEEESSFYSNSDDNEIKSLVTDLMEQTITLTDTLENDNELESIELPVELLDVPLDNGNAVKSVDVPIDYSKMSVRALKDMVSSKNLATNVSKLKKKDLIDLLSV
jgi:hypothetical protein